MNTEIQNRINPWLILVNCNNEKYSILKNWNVLNSDFLNEYVLLKKNKGYSLDEINKMIVMIFEFIPTYEEMIDIINYKMLKLKKEQNSEIWESINLTDNIVLVEELNLQSLNNSHLIYYSWWDDNYSALKELSHTKNYRIYDKKQWHKEVWFLAFIYDQEDGDLFIEFLTIFENNAWWGYWKEVMEGLFNYYNVNSLSWEIINADDWATYWFWKSINNKLCKKYNINFEMSFQEDNF